jgi:prophage regulatory protein
MTRIAINKKRLLQIVPLGYTSIWELERAGKFPASFLLTEKTRVWYLDEIEEWLEQRRARLYPRTTCPTCASARGQ